MLTAFMLAAILAQTSPAIHDYRVQFRSRMTAGVTTGELKLTFLNDGYVNGTYRPDSGGLWRPIHGGYKGNQIWFTISGLYVQATMTDSGISGVAASTGVGRRQYLFTATPEASPR